MPQYKTQLNEKYYGKNDLDLSKQEHRAKQVIRRYNGIHKNLF